MRRSKHLLDDFPIVGACLFFFCIVLSSSSANAQTSTDSLLHIDSVIHSKDTSKVISIKPFKRPLAEQRGSNVLFTNTAIRYYGSPSSMVGVFDEAVAAYPLQLGDQGYGRESFLRTSRTSEGLAGSFLNGILPLTDPIDGTTGLNYFPSEIASSVTLSSGGILTAADRASSDVVNYELETFRAPVAYSRLHYTQETSHSFSNFEGLFSVNTAEPLNLTFGVYRRASGTAQTSSQSTFNPRTDRWWVRSQATYSSKDINGLFLLLYNSSFSGLNGGGNILDSTTDIFDVNLAPVKFSQAFEHRTRLDLLAQAGFGLFSSTDLTQISAYTTLASRRLLTLDSNFRVYGTPLSKADRIGLTIAQPADLHIGEFATRALLRGDLQYLNRSSDSSVFELSEKRYSVLAADSLSFGSAIGISVNGYFRWTISQLTVASVPQPDLALTNFGLEGSARLSRALSVTAQLQFAHDRATLSPNPTATYDLNNLGFFGTFSLPLGKTDSIAISAGVLNRTEPEGIVLTPVDNIDSLYQPIFSSTAIHSQGINASANLWFDKFRFSAQAEYLPSVHPLSNYTNNTSLISDLDARIFAASGLYYESELAEGALRLSFGARVRYFNKISPSLTYDPSSDYYIYQGLPRLGSTAYNDSRLSTSVFPIDILASALVDQRAYINVSFLNILSVPYYTSFLYPRNGFTFRLDVTWAFLN